jgi:predicted small lipoprotein YifL
MKERIYLSLFIIVATLSLTGCGGKGSTPTAVVTPTPTPISTTPALPSPVPTTSQPTAQLSPSVPSALPSPVPVQIPTVQPTPAVSPATTKISALPKSLYPQPTPVAIPVPAESPQTKANPKPDPLSKLKTPTDPSQKITPVGIGAAKIGMTFKELKAQMGTGFEFTVKTNFIVGFDAIAVTKAGTVQYYIPYPTGTQFTDTDRIQHLMTDNPNYRTEKGVGPGTSIEQATAVYGGATLSMSKENESREFINFTQHPTGLAFRPKPVGTRTFAGEYPESNEEYLKTQKYDNRAAIGQITVSCSESQCDPDH